MAVGRSDVADDPVGFEVPDHDAWSRRRYGAHWAGYHTPRHTALWDRRTMRVLLERAGWRVDSIEPSGTLDPWTLVWMSRMERKGIDWSASMWILVAVPPLSAMSAAVA